MNYTKNDIMDYVVYPSLINFLLFWIASSIFIALDDLYERYGFLKSHRIQDKTADWKKYKSTILYVIMNQLCVNLPSFAMCIGLNKNMNNVALPLHWLPLQLVGIAILEDILFYWLHRLLHTKKFYWIHKRHHEWHVTSGLTSQYSHPIEHFCCNVFPILFCGYVFRLNWLCFNIWINLATLNAILVHSSFDMMRMSTNHDIHHQYFKYSYGVTGLMDYLCNTNKPPKATITN